MHNMVDKSVNLNWDEWKIIILNPNKKEKKEKKEKEPLQAKTDLQIS